MTIECLNECKWVLHTQKTTYAFGLGVDEMLTHLYWGPRLSFSSDIPEPLRTFHASFNNMQDMANLEYPSQSGMAYHEVCLKARLHDGGRDVILNFDSYSIGDVEIREEKCPKLTMILKDPHYSLTVHLHYIVYEKYDLIERYSEIINTGSELIQLDQAFSAAFYVPEGFPYRLTTISGGWAAEYTLNQEMLVPGKKVIESRRGATSHNSHPWFALDRGNSQESSGDVWFGVLKWSGNWKMSFEHTPRNQIRILVGLNNYDFTWGLLPKNPLITPSVILGITSQGFGQASRNLHHFQEDLILPKKHNKKLRKILYNSWEATYFDVNLENQTSLAEKAASIGVELFVMDDGWFGQRNTDMAGLGDWYVNTQKFPEGLDPLINKVNELGMDFGLWVEPEMVNPDSDLYRAHPEWVFQFPNREITRARHQLNLNLAKPEVKDFVFHMVDDLLNKYNIKFIKWDWNKSISEPGWPDVPKEHQQEVMVHYIKNLYDIFSKLRASHPNVVFETCSGGGGRIDMGILSFTDQAWISDNTNPYDRLFIQEGYSHIYCPKSMVCWVTDAGDDNLFSLKYRFYSSMMGTLGIGANLNNYTEKQLKIAKKHIKRYKEIRPLIQEGEMYRLLSPRAGNLSAVQYMNVEKTEGVVFIFLQSSKFPENRFRLIFQGLNPESQYKISKISQKLSGRLLMSLGALITLDGHFKSELLKVTQIE
ncbi:alpha-galactosidase [Candidatus Lokiarchaeum ossiferum]|uniref:alpha-galactosidase n=1 Tax=Candidatus Lokiarchaeum ossiferum TaxID=2951803 RepID=UPI00352FE930